MEKVDYVLDPENANPTIVLLVFSYYYQPIAKPENIVSFYGDNVSDLIANADAFQLTSDNFIGFFQDISTQDNFKIEKLGDKICFTQYGLQYSTGYPETYVKSMEYYEKDGTNFYKYSSTNNSWVKTSISQTDYEYIENKMFNSICGYNPVYANYKTDFSSWSSSGDLNKFYTLTGKTKTNFFMIFVANDRVVKMVARDNDNSNKLAYEYSFSYGTANVVLPTIAE